MRNDSNDNLLEAWNNDADVTAAQFSVDSEISAVELAGRVSKMFVPY